jgi:hypothetical protein
MNLKRVWFFIVILVFIVIASRSSLAIIDTRPIDNIRNKTTINSGDIKIIENFLDDAVKELVRTKDNEFASISKTRAVILTRKGQGQFADQFIKTAYQKIESGLQQARTLSEDRQFNVVLNLLILMDGLQDSRFVDLAKAYLGDPRPGIRYWATRVLTNETIINIVNQNQGASSELMELTVTALREQIERGSPEVLGLITQFTGKVTAVQTQDLLLDMANQRIRAYADWTVQEELLDNHILKQLARRMKANPADQGICGPRFGQLYSYVIQRYLKGTGTLDETQKQQLISVIAEVEDQSIATLLNRPQSSLRRALEQKNNSELLREHDRLLGNQTTAGQLPAKLNFSYTAQGGTSQAPATLSMP